MKKLLISVATIVLLVFVATITLLVSCNGGKKTAEEQAEEVKSFEQEQIEAGIKVQLDSLANLYASMDDSPVMVALKSGEILLTDEEKQVKPDYLLAPEATNDLVTLSQKYRAVGILSIDEFVAESYDMSTEEMKAARSRLIVELNDPGFDVFIKESYTDSTFAKVFEEFYNAEEEAGRINFFWETVTAAFVEQIFILTQNPDKYLAAFDDQKAADFTYRLILLQNGLENLQEYAPEIEELCNAIKPLEGLNAISVDQLRNQVTTLKQEITDVRNGLLK